VLFGVVGEEIELRTRVQEESFGGKRWMKRILIEKGRQESKELVTKEVKMMIPLSGSEIGLKPGEQVSMSWVLIRDRTVKGQVVLAMASSRAWLESINAVRVIYDEERCRLESFRHANQNGSKGWAPFGYFVNWGGWLMDAPTNEVEVNEKFDAIVGDTFHPVPPFEPSFREVTRLMNRTRDQGLFWEYDMRHHTLDINEINRQVMDYRHSGGVSIWYLSDEPDGEGDIEGSPTGRITPEQLQEAYNQVRELDPYHPVSVSLNCMRSTALYMKGLDIILPDVYPIGIEPIRCSNSYGCCGCDECQGKVTDVTKRLDAVTEQSRGLRPIGFVGQSFGGEEHWYRSPTREEFRAMSYLAMMHPGGLAGGMRYWLRSETDSPLISEAQLLSREVALVSSVAYEAGAETIRVKASLEGVIARAFCSKSGVLLLALLNLYGEEVSLQLPPSVPGIWSLPSHEDLGHLNIPESGAHDTKMLSRKLRMIERKNKKKTSTVGKQVGWDSLRILGQDLTSLGEGWLTFGDRTMKDSRKMKALETRLYQGECVVESVSVSPSDAGGASGSQRLEL